MADYLNISEDLANKIKVHYSRTEIIEAMLKASPDKEVVGSYGGVAYAKRPDTIEFNNDIKVLTNKGVTSFHISEEIWFNPLSLEPRMDKNQILDLRKGWDLIIDVDCPHWEICKYITHHITQEIKDHGICNVSVKFSGNKGFHIGIPQESFPDKYRCQFPEMPRKIAAYLLERIIHKAKEDMIKILKSEFGDLYQEHIEEIFNKPKEQLIKDNDINPYKIIEVDTLLISQRHLYRMVYSVNEKSGLVSIPINPDKIINFEKDLAKIENNIVSKYSFLDRTKSNSNEATKLCIEAIDSQVILEKGIIEDAKEGKQITESQREFEEQNEEIPEEDFPESIKKLLKGNLQDGKKRALFLLRNFLICVGWSFDKIDSRLKTWNKTHLEPLRDTVFKTQLMYAKQMITKNQRMMPPNYSSVNYYHEIIGDMPEFKKAKNPVSLAISNFNQSKHKDDKKKKTSSR